jgi:hypothetical protein
MNQILPPFLYHGTRVAHQACILEYALVPRGQSGVSQWQHTAESRVDAVYLTDAYPLHFALNAQAEGDLLIVEVDTSKLELSALIADEDALAHSLKETATRHMSLLEKTLYYREHSHDYSWAHSLTLMGTCAHLGPVPAAAIHRVARVRIQDAGTLVLGGFDPVVSPVNYSIFGDEYRESVKWLFGDMEVCAVNPNMPRVPIEVTKVKHL